MQEVSTIRTRSDSTGKARNVLPWLPTQDRHNKPIVDREPFSQRIVAGATARSIAAPAPAVSTSQLDSNRVCSRAERSGLTSAELTTAFTSAHSVQEPVQHAACTDVVVRIRVANELLRPSTELSSISHRFAQALKSATDVAGNTSIRWRSV
jgi:hypothetical protein